MATAVFSRVCPSVEAEEMANFNVNALPGEGCCVNVGVQCFSCCLVTICFPGLP